MFFKPLKSNEKNLQAQVATVIKNAIINGDLKPGSKLPSERDLAGMLNVSRGSLREALSHLHATGLIIIKHGVGVFIKDTDPDNIITGFAMHLVSDKKRIIELFEIRKLLETQSAAWAARRGDPEIIEELYELVQSVKGRIDNVQYGQLTLLADQDTRFHILIAEASGNSIFVKIMNDLLDVLDESRSKTYAIPGRTLKSLNDHIEIAKAIKERNPESAECAMMEHLVGVEKDIMSNFYSV